METPFGLSWATFVKLYQPICSGKGSNFPPGFCPQNSQCAQCTHPFQCSWQHSWKSLPCCCWEQLHPACGCERISSKSHHAHLEGSLEHTGMLEQPAERGTPAWWQILHWLWWPLGAGQEAKGLSCSQGRVRLSLQGSESLQHVVKSLQEDLNWRSSSHHPPARLRGSSAREMDWVTSGGVLLALFHHSKLYLWKITYFILGRGPVT